MSFSFPSPGCFYNLFLLRHVHGGAIASVLDVIMGNCAFYSGYNVVTANLSINYKR